MINCEIVSSKGPKMTAVGNTTTLAAETSILIKMIYDSIRMNNPVDAAPYIHGIVGVLTDPNSPMYQEHENEQSELEQNHDGEGD